MLLCTKRGHVGVKRTREYLNLNVNPFHRGRVQTRGSKLNNLFPKFSSKYIVMFETLAVRLGIGTNGLSQPLAIAI